MAALPLTTGSVAPTVSSDPNGGKSRKVLIIFTGGTIGMAVSDGGFLKPQKGFLHNVLSSFSEIHHPDMPLFDILEWDDPKDSSDFSPDDWIKLGLQINEHYYNYQGFVILSGTDTLCYTASMLSFMFENLSKTVVLTGAMIPLQEPTSDAKRNLIISILVSAHLNIPEVLVFFNSHLLRGNRAKKVDPWKLDAFDSPSCEPIATMGVSIEVNNKILLPPPSRRFHCHTKLFTNIICLTITPSFSYSGLRSVATSWRHQPRDEKNPPEPPAIILLLFGSGNAPIKHDEWKETLDLLISEQCTVVVLSQCLRGSTSLDTYEGGNYMKQLGVIDGLDLTIEACTTKLSYLMGRGLRGPHLKLAMETNLRGELSKKTNVSYFMGSALPSDLQARL
jgi:L-asparaginase